WGQLWEETPAGKTKILDLGGEGRSYVHDDLQTRFTARKVRWYGSGYDSCVGVAPADTATTVEVYGDGAYTPVAPGMPVPLEGERWIRVSKDGTVRQVAWTAGGPPTTPAPSVP